MKIPQVFKGPKGQTKVGYTSFPMDNLLNMTSVCGYLLPVYYDVLEPGDKVKISNILRTITQPLTKPAMATICERVEWFAVPIDQLYKPFKTKYFGINDVESDLLPTSGYTNALPFISLTELTNYLNSCPTSFAAQQATPLTRPLYGEVKRLYDCLGYPRDLGITIGSGETYAGSVNLLLPAAYQKIYYDHYRLTDRIPNDPAAYNLDSMYNPTGLTNAANQSRLDKLFALHKRPYRLDYFTSMKVSPLMGSSDVNASGASLTNISQWLTGLDSLKTGVPTNSANFPYGGAMVPSNSLPNTVLQDTASGSGNVNQNGMRVYISSVNPVNIRSMFAVEKLLEVTRRAKKHYDMQVLAHFGIDVPKGLAGECFKIGTHEQYIKINDVMNTADTGLAAVGARSGAGESGAKSKDFYFEAKCHCILMAIYSAEPVMNYCNVGLERITSRTSVDDFFKPEYDNLGMQPVFARELMLVPELTASITSKNSFLAN